MSLNQLYMTRPTYMNPSFSTPDIKGLYLCGSGAHPGKIYILFTPTCICSHFLSLSLSPSFPPFLSPSMSLFPGGGVMGAPGRLAALTVLKRNA